MPTPRPQYRDVPLTPDHWDDLVDLFVPERGACAGCWCMSPRVSRADFEDMGKTKRKAAFAKLVETGPPPGLLLYDGKMAIGWVAVGPRRSVARFDQTKSSRLPDDETDDGRIWAITCFYTRSSHRKAGLMPTLTNAAVAFAKRNGARAVDVCPIEADRPLTWGDGFTGIASVFRRLKFKEVARRSPRRPLMRMTLLAKS